MVARGKELQGQNLGTLGPANVRLIDCTCRECKRKSGTDKVPCPEMSLAWAALDAEGRFNPANSGVWRCTRNHNIYNGPLPLGPATRKIRIPGRDKKDYPSYAAQLFVDLGLDPTEEANRLVLHFCANPDDPGHTLLLLVPPAFDCPNLFAGLLPGFTSRRGDIVIDTRPRFTKKSCSAVFGARGFAKGADPTTCLWQADPRVAERGRTHIQKRKRGEGAAAGSAAGPSSGGASVTNTPTEETEEEEAVAEEEQEAVQALSSALPASRGAAAQPQAAQGPRAAGPRSPLAAKVNGASPAITPETRHMLMQRLREICPGASPEELERMMPQLVYTAAHYAPPA
jgi:hypothetical protein